MNKNIFNSQTMLKPITRNFKGLIIISGSIKSGKSKLAEFLVKEQESITYIATSKPRLNDPEWERKITAHRKRRPISWNLVEHPPDICNEIESIGDRTTFLIDSLGGLVEQYLMENNDQWERTQRKFIRCFLNNKFGIIIVSEEIGWGIVPATPIGHLFRERLTTLSSILCKQASKRWLAVNGIAIDLDKIGSKIP